MQVANGTTDVTTYFVLRDSTNHAPKTDVTVTDIDLYYCEQGAAMAAKVDATALAAADSAHADNKAFHVGQGLYRVDWPDAAFDGGVGKVVNLIVVCTGVDTTFLEVELTGVAQTGDAYAVVAHADYGNAKLVRSTTPANTLDVSATGEAGLDFANIKAATAPTTLTNIVVPTVTTLTGHTAQTGDSFARLGAPAGASVSADIAAVKAQTAAIEADTQDLQTQVGTDGAGLTAVPWNAAWDAEVQSEAADALTAYDPPTKAELDSAVAPLATAAALATVDGIVDAILVDTGTTLDGKIDTIDGIVDDILVDTGTTLDTLIKDVPTVAEFEARTLVAADYVVVGDTLAAVTTVGSVTGAVGSVTGDVGGNVVGSVASVTGNVGGNVMGSIGSLAAQAKADVNAEVDTALNTAIPGAPTADSINERIKAIDDLTQAAGAGDLAAILTDTAEIGAAGAGLSAIPWNAAWDAEVESECDDALVGFNLPTNDTIADAVWNEASAHHVAAGSTGKVIADILEDTGTTIPADIAALPTDADVQTAATAALNAYDPPTNAEMEARTILAASYFDPAADTVAHVTLVDTTTTNTDMVAAAPAVGDIADAVWDEAIAGHAVAGSTGAALSAATAPTAAAVADAVWEEAIADHSGTVGSTAEQLAAAGAAGDPWITALPGAYAAGTAGDIIGNLVTDVGSLVPAVAVSSTTAASVASGILAIRAYHTLDQQITSTTTSDLSSATKLWLAIKIAASDDDDEAVAFIEVVDGLTVLAQAAYTTVAHGSLTLGGVAGAWTIDVGMDEVATGLLTAYAGQMLHAECKALVGGATVAVWDGVCDVSHGIVHAVA